MKDTLPDCKFLQFHKVLTCSQHNKHKNIFLVWPEINIMTRKKINITKFGKLKMNDKNSGQSFNFPLIPWVVWTFHKIIIMITSPVNHCGHRGIMCTAALTEVVCLQQARHSPTFSRMI